MNPAQTQSWQKTQRELTERQAEVLECLRSHPDGLGSWEISRLTGRYVHAVRPRLGELIEKALITPSGQRWEDTTQRHETVWKIVSQDTAGQIYLI